MSMHPKHTQIRFHIHQRGDGGTKNKDINENRLIWDLPLFKVGEYGLFSLSLSPSNLGDALLLDEAAVCPSVPLLALVARGAADHLHAEVLVQQRLDRDLQCRGLSA